MGILLRVLHVLAGIVCVYIAYLVCLWVLSMLGLQVPDKILTAIFVLLALLAAIGAFSGKFDNWWRANP